MKATLVSLAALLMLSGCADRKNISPLPTIPPKAKADLTRPVNCGTASADIQTLEDERASVGKQILAGVRSIMPIAAVAGILMGDYRDRVNVAIGSYNDDIEAKIDLIKARCGVN